MAQTSGYSGKPLFQKLGFKPGWQVLLRNAPIHYPELMQGVEDVTFVEQGAGPFNAVHFFLNNSVLSQSDVQDNINRLNTGGMLWLSWAKKSSRLFNGITEDALRDVVLPLGWVDVKVCAVDKDWSGLKFLRRKTG